MEELVSDFVSLSYSTHLWEFKGFIPKDLGYVSHFPCRLLKHSFSQDFYSESNQIWRKLLLSLLSSNDNKSFMFTDTMSIIDWGRNLCKNPLPQCVLIRLCSWILSRSGGLFFKQKYATSDPSLSKRWSSVWCSPAACVNFIVDVQGKCDWRSDDEDCERWCYCRPFLAFADASNGHWIVTEHLKRKSHWTVHSSFRQLRMESQKQEKQNFL